MAKKIVSFAIEPEEKERIDAIIERRQSENSEDRELNFSKWMRDAVLEKLAREDIGPPKKAPAGAEQRVSGRTSAKAARGANPETGYRQSSPHGVNETDPDAPVEIAPVIPARAKGTPRPRSTAPGIRRIVSPKAAKG